MIRFAPCKINIGLDVTARRPDGYHDIATVMVPVPGLCDVVEVVAAPGGGAEFSSSGLELDCPPRDNLCVRAWSLLHGRYGIGGALIHLHKAVPFGAGLGGGSSDAAHTLRALNDVFGLGLDAASLEGLGAELGSDVPFFIGDTPRIAAGRGEWLSPADIDLSGVHILIVKPPVHVSTAAAYRGVVPHKPETPLGQRLGAPVGQWRGNVSNAFEPSVFAAHPELAAVKERLYGMGAEYASMSGSGSALYGLFDGEPPEADWPDGYFIHDGIL